MSAMNSMGMRPEERKDAVRAQLREAARILAGLEARRDVSAEAFEMELRMQILWLTNAANQWRQANCEEAHLLRLRGIYLLREGPGQ